MSANHENGKPKKDDTSRKTSRRTALKGLVTGAIASTTIGLGSRPARAGQQDPTTAALQNYRMNHPRLDDMKGNPASRDQYLAMVQRVSSAMTQDPKLATTVLGCLDSVTLLNLFNQNRKEIEAVVGRVDGRTSEGRYAKMLHASELFENVNNFDRTKLLGDSEEIALYTRSATGEDALFAVESSSSSSSGSVCGSCGSSSYWFLGCCIIHNWDWSAGMSGCSPCA